MSVNFMAIDFETSNPQRASICSAEIVIVEKGEIITQKHWLIKPHKNYEKFNPICVSRHGITEGVVENKPEFIEIYEQELEKYIKDFFIFSHCAASADISMLKQTLELYNAEVPNLNYGCSRNLSKKVFPELLNFRLDTIAKFLNIPINHHNALSDALACAKIVIHAYQKYGHDIFEMSQAKSVPTSKETIRSKKTTRIKRDTPAFNNEKPFLGKKFVFTGALQSFKRAEAHQIVENAGGRFGPGVTLDTNFLVVGESDFIDFSSGKKTSKLKKAEAIRSRGGDIELLSEEEFLQMMT